MPGISKRVRRMHEELRKRIFEFHKRRMEKLGIKNEEKVIVIPKGLHRGISDKSLATVIKKLEKEGWQVLRLGEKHIAVLDYLGLIKPEPGTYTIPFRFYRVIGMNRETLKDVLRNLRNRYGMNFVVKPIEPSERESEVLSYMGKIGEREYIYQEGLHSKIGISERSFISALGRLREKGFEIHRIPKDAVGVHLKNMAPLTKLQQAILGMAKLEGDKWVIPKGSWRKLGVVKGTFIYNIKRLREAGYNIEYERKGKKVKEKSKRIRKGKKGQLDVNKLASYLNEDELDLVRNLVELKGSTLRLWAMVNNRDGKLEKKVSRIIERLPGEYRSILEKKLESIRKGGK